MKTRTASRLFQALTLTAVLALAARNVAAQSSPSVAAQTAPVQLSYGVSQIIQLSQANVSEGTIVNYIQNSDSSYGLDANQIVYLKQQGVSDAVVNTMLNQPRPVAQTASPSDYPPASTTAVQPSVTYVPAQSSTVYVIPDTQTYSYYASSYRPYGARYYYPSYSPYHYYGGYYPSVSFSFGFGGGHWGGYSRGGWGGGYRGGYRGGGGWHR
jgi:uncharacterized protein YbaA (DUF1428 family)